MSMPTSFRVWAFRLRRPVSFVGRWAKNEWQSSAVLRTGSSTWHWLDWIFAQRIRHTRVVVRCTSARVDDILSARVLYSYRIRILAAWGAAPSYPICFHSCASWSWHIIWYRYRLGDVLLDRHRASSFACTYMLSLLLGIVILWRCLAFTMNFWLHPVTE